MPAEQNAKKRETPDTPQTQVLRLLTQPLAGQASSYKSDALFHVTQGNLDYACKGRCYAADAVIEQSPATYRAFT